MESALFGQVNEVEIIKLPPHEVDHIHNTYVELARTGANSEEHHRRLTALAHTLVKRDGVDAIILAGPTPRCSSVKPTLIFLTSTARRCISKRS
jgi:hypothetical protein